jgi:hypothetical protein
MGFMTRHCGQVKSCSVEHKTGWTRICVVAISSPVSDFFQISHSWLQVTRLPSRHPPRSRPNWHNRKKENDRGSSQAGMSISLELVRYYFVTILSCMFLALCHQFVSLPYAMACHSPITPSPLGSYMASKL